MRILIFVVALMVALIIAFSALNWTALNAPATINVLFTDVEGPLGLVVLMFAAALMALLLLLVLFLQVNVLLEARRHSRELSAQRGLADKAEASRFTELRQMLEAEFAKLSSRGAPTTELVARLDRLEEGLRKELQDSSNSLAAYVGELESRLEEKQIIPPDDDGPRPLQANP